MNDRRYDPHPSVKVTLLWCAWYVSMVALAAWVGSWNG